MTASAHVGRMCHFLARHGWHIEPLVLIEDAPDGPYLAALLPFVPRTAEADADDASPNGLADRLIAELTASDFPAPPGVV